MIAEPDARAEEVAGSPRRAPVSHAPPDSRVLPVPTTPANLHNAEQDAVAPSLARDLAQLTKLRLSSLVLVTTALGYLDVRGAAAALGTLGGALAFTGALLGTAAAAFGANALNQWAERDLDSKMMRTRNRPVPGGRMAPAFAARLGVALVISGIALLALLANPLSAALAALSAASYVLVYTPLKRVTPHAVLVGAVPGALPPVIGYVAAGGALDATALFLFAVLFLWQIPHFHAISWLWRDDYARAGYPMLAVLDTDGRRIGRSAVLHLVALFVVSLLPVLQGDGGAALFYGAAAALFGGVFVAAGVAFQRERSDANARRLFHWSLLYLPALLLALVKDTL